MVSPGRSIVCLVWANEDESRYDYEDHRQNANSPDCSSFLQPSPPSQFRDAPQDSPRLAVSVSLSTLSLSSFQSFVPRTRRPAVLRLAYLPAITQTLRT